MSKNEIEIIDEDEELAGDLIEQPTFDLSKLPPDIQAKIKAASDILKGSTSIAVNKIRNGHNRYTFPDNSEAQSFVGIIVGIKHANIHYKGQYTKGVVNPADCFAVVNGDEDLPNDQLTPHANVAKPHSKTCKDCEKFKWKSAAVGKGKACAEYLLLAVYVPALGTDDLLLLEQKKANARVADGYIAQLRAKYGHPMVVTTRFAIGETNEWDQTFQAVGITNNAIIEKLGNRIDEANLMLTERALGAYNIEDG